MIPQIVTVTLAAAADNNVAASQAPGAATLTINGSAATAGVATLDYQRHVIITSSGNDSGITFKITGTRNDGGVITETITGANAGIAESTLDFKTVTAVLPSGAVAANVKVGTNGIGASPWQALSAHTAPFAAGVQIAVTGTINVDIEITSDDPNGPLGAFPPAPVNPTAFKHAYLQGITASAIGMIDQLCWGWRVRVNSGSGSAKVTTTQAGMRSA